MVIFFPFFFFFFCCCCCFRHLPEDAYSLNIPDTPASSSLPSPSPLSPAPPSSPSADQLSSSSSRSSLSQPLSSLSRMPHLSNKLNFRSVPLLPDPFQGLQLYFLTTPSSVPSPASSPSLPSSFSSSGTSSPSQSAQTSSSSSSPSLDSALIKEIARCFIAYGGEMTTSCNPSTTHAIATCFSPSVLTLQARFPRLLVVHPAWALHSIRNKQRENETKYLVRKERTLSNKQWLIDWKRSSLK